MRKIYEHPKRKGALIVLEGFSVALLAHALGGYYLAPTLAEHVFTRLPLETLYWLCSSATSPVAAIIYLALRLRFVPSFRVRRETLISLLPGVVLIWMLNFIDVMIFGKTSFYLEDVLGVPPPYLYLNMFLLMVWGPLIEEVLFRGYFFETLRKNWRDVTALIASSVLFVIPHGLWGAVYFINTAPLFSVTLLGITLIPIFISSIILTYFYIKGGLISAILLHIFSNVCYYYWVM